ncbi:hypothetical protein, partial [Plantactinospora endophytica]
MTLLGTGARSVVWRPATWALGAVEARRLLRHPVYPVALSYVAAIAAAGIVRRETGPAANFGYIVAALALLLGYAPATLVAANRVAAATFRSRVREPLDSTPVDDRQRTVAVILGLVRGPVLVGLATAGLLLVVGEFTTPYPERRVDVVYQRTALEYLQLPALVLGAGLLGVAVARWLPWPGALPSTVLVVWLGTIATYQSSTTGTVADPAWFALWPVWIATDEGMLPRQPLGQE